jgi:hypothetical protein
MPTKYNCCVAEGRQAWAQPWTRTGTGTGTGEGAEDSGCFRGNQ